VAKTHEERIEKTAQKAVKKMKRVEKRMSRAAMKAERNGHLLRMFEVPPADANKPKKGEDKPSGARMYLRAFRPKIAKADGATTGHEGAGTHGGADEAAIYEIHLPDHGDAKVYGTSPKGAFKKAMKYMALYSKMLTEQMFPGGQGAKLPEQGKPKEPKPKKDGEGLQVVSLAKDVLDQGLVLKS
jgi:hypothetical protein